MRREVLHRAGGLDAEFGWPYRSDRIYSDVLRHIHGLKIYHVSKAEVVHKLQVSTKELAANSKDEFDLMFKQNQWDETDQKNFWLSYCEMGYFVAAVLLVMYLLFLTRQPWTGFKFKPVLATQRTPALQRKIYLFANNKRLENSDIPKLRKHDLAFLFNDPWPLKPEAKLPIFKTVPIANRWVFLPGCNWPNLYNSCITDIILCADIFGQNMANIALKLGREGNIGKLVFWGGDAFNIQRRVNISIDEMYIRPQLNYANIEYPPPRVPSSGFVTFLYAEKTLSLDGNSDHSQIVLVGFSRLGTEYHNFTFEQAYYKSRGALIVLPSVTSDK